MYIETIKNITKQDRIDIINSVITSVKRHPGCIFSCLEIKNELERYLDRRNIRVCYTVLASILRRAFANYNFDNAYVYLLINQYSKKRTDPSNIKDFDVVWFVDDIDRIGFLEFYRDNLIELDVKLAEKL